MKYDRIFRKSCLTGMLLLCCLLCCRPAFSQEHMQLQGNGTADTQRIMRGLDEARKLMATSWQSAFDLDRKYLQLSRMQRFRRGQIRALRNLTDLYWNENTDTAIAYISEAIALSKPMGDERQLMEEYASLAALYEISGDFPRVMQLYAQVKDLFRQHATGTHRYLLSRLMNNMGRAYFQTGRFDSALLYYEHSLSNLPHPDSTSYIDAMLANSALGMIYARIHIRGKGIAYFRQAYEIAKDFGDSAMQISQLSNLGVVYYEMNDYAAAKKYLYQVLGMHTGDRQVPFAQIYGMLAAVLCHDSPDSLSRALDYARLSYKYTLAHNNLENRIQASYIMGLALRKNGLYSQAEKYLLDGIGLALEKGKVENISMAYSNLSEVYRSTGRFEKALDYQTRYIQIKDSLEGAENARQIADVEQQYKTVEKDKALAEQKAAMQIQESRIREMNFWIAGIVITCLLLLSLFFVIYKSNRNRQKASLLHLQQQQEIGLLKAKSVAEEEERKRIGKELHDGIVSQLLAIKLHINALHDKQPEPLGREQLGLVARQLEEATAELRTTAHNLMPESLVQQGLVKAISALCGKIARNDLTEVDFQTYGAIPAFSNYVTLSLYRIVQELIQNVLKHAGATFLLVQLSFREGILSITVEDNGKGFSEGDMEDAEGLGLISVRKRVAELNGSIDISSRPGLETTIYMEFEDKWLL